MTSAYFSTIWHKIQQTMFSYVFLSSSSQAPAVIIYNSYTDILLIYEPQPQVTQAILNLLMK